MHFLLSIAEVVFQKLRFHHFPHLEPFHLPHLSPFLETKFYYISAVQMPSMPPIQNFLQTVPFLIIVSCPENSQAM